MLDLPYTRSIVIAIIHGQCMMSDEFDIADALKLYVDKNPFTCTKELQWLFHPPVRIQVTLSYYPCSNPSKLRRQSVYQLRRDTFQLGEYSYLPEVKTNLMKMGTSQAS